MRRASLLGPALALVAPAMVVAAYGLQLATRRRFAFELREAAHPALLRTAPVAAAAAVTVIMLALAAVLAVAGARRRLDPAPGMERLSAREAGCLAPFVAFLPLLFAGASPPALAESWARHGLRGELLLGAAIALFFAAISALVLLFRRTVELDPGRRALVIELGTPFVLRRRRIPWSDVAGLRVQGLRRRSGVWWQVLAVHGRASIVLCQAASEADATAIAQGLARRVGWTLLR